MDCRVPVISHITSESLPCIINASLMHFFVNLPQRNKKEKKKKNPLCCYESPPSGVGILSTLYSNVHEIKNPKVEVEVERANPVLLAHLQSLGLCTVMLTSRRFLMQPPKSWLNSTLLKSAACFLVVFYLLLIAICNLEENAHLENKQIILCTAAEQESENLSKA